MIGIHDSPGSFSDRWIDYCIHKQIPFKRLNCLASDILHQCDGLTAVFWHWSQDSPIELLVARQIIFALEQKGIIVFPNMATCSHFDDKVAQKYLLEAIDAPLARTWIFYDSDTALKWIREAAWPKVFKLRCGAGSTNVRLVHSRNEAEALCRQAFKRGFPAFAGYLNDMRTRLCKTKSSKQFWEKLRRAPHTIINHMVLNQQMPRQRGYLYFQDFIPGNAHDTRVTIIGNRGFAFRRLVRKNDFRASGSGQIDYDAMEIDMKCVEIAFQVAHKLDAQSIAFDFVMAHDSTPKIVEISYCYASEAVQNCPGYWDRDLNWHEGKIWPQDAIIKDVIAELNCVHQGEDYQRYVKCQGR
jgi:hypothetical protein